MHTELHYRGASLTFLWIYLVLHSISCLFLNIMYGGMVTILFFYILVSISLPSVIIYSLSIISWLSKYLKFTKSSIPLSKSYLYIHCSLLQWKQEWSAMLYLAIYLFSFAPVGIYCMSILVRRQCYVWIFEVHNCWISLLITNFSWVVYMLLIWFIVSNT